MSQLPPELASRRVLMVEDEAHARRVIVDKLEELGFNSVRQALNGAEAMQVLEHTRFPIDLVISDLSMPEMDGFAFVEQVRKSRKYFRDIPIIILSGNQDAEAVVRLRGLGVNGYLVKPVTLEALEERIRFVFRYR